MISPAITVHDEFIIIYKGDYFIFWENDNALSLYCLLKRVPNLLNDIPFEQVRDLAIKNGSEVSIHRGDNNQIRDKNSYGNDPRKTKG